MTMQAEAIGGPFDLEEMQNLVVAHAAGVIAVGHKTRGFGQGRTVLPGGKSQYYFGDAKLP